jgi:hypothetical protein
LNPQNVSISAKTRKMRTIENSRKTEEKQRKQGKRRASPTNSMYTRQTGNAGKRLEHSGKAEGNKREKVALTEPALMSTAPLTSLGLMSGTLLAAIS